MSNRILARYNDAVPEILEDGEPHNVGMWEEMTIERSAAGAPGLLFIITRYENDQVYDQMCVSVAGGTEFLAPVNGWLNGNDPEPWVWFGTDLRSSVAHEGEALDFNPRPAYNQNRDGYSPRIPVTCVCGATIHSTDCTRRGHLRGPQVSNGEAPA